MFRQRQLWYKDSSEPSRPLYQNLHIALGWHHSLLKLYKPLVTGGTHTATMLWQKKRHLVLSKWKHQSVSVVLDWIISVHHRYVVHIHVSSQNSDGIPCRTRLFWPWLVTLWLMTRWWWRNVVAVLEEEFLDSRSVIVSILFCMGRRLLEGCGLCTNSFCNNHNKPLRLQSIQWENNAWTWYQTMQV